MSGRDSAGYYKALNLTSNATADEIKQNYRELAKKWHPDYNKSEEAMEIFQKISVAHDILSDDKKRLTYDLACIAHGAENFPDIFSLKVYTNQHGQEEVSVREVDIEEQQAWIIRDKKKKKRLICSEKEAEKEYLKSSVKNWLLGWWTLKGFVENIRIIRSNIKNVGEKKEENLQLLVHNALAYQQEHKYSEAYVCASQAWNYAAPYQKELLEKFLKSLPDVKTLPQPYWNYRRLQQVQLIVPSLLLAAILGFSVIGGMRIFHPAASDKLSYYQEVQHWRGGRGVDDVVVAKIMDIRVDLNSFNMLYHISPTTGVEVMYGPSDKFDVLTTLSQGHTVRVTGISPDKVWMRIMLDNGDMGFVHSADLVEGIGSPIPVNSQIYTGAR